MQAGCSPKTYKDDLLGGQQPAGPDDGEAGRRAGLHHRQHGEQHDGDDG